MNATDGRLDTLHPLDRLAARALQGDGLTYGERSQIAKILTAEARRQETTVSETAPSDACRTALANIMARIDGDEFVPTEYKEDARKALASVPSAIRENQDAKDAARYRWLRDYGHSHVVVGSASMSQGRGPYIRLDPPANNQFSGMTLWAEEADAVIDGFMK